MVLKVTLFSSKLDTYSNTAFSLLSQKSLCINNISFIRTPIKRAIMPSFGVKVLSFEYLKDHLIIQQFHNFNN